MLFNKVADGGQVDAAVLNFSEAFDKVPHSRLMKNLFLMVFRVPLTTESRHFSLRDNNVSFFIVAHLVQFMSLLLFPRVLF